MFRAVRYQSMDYVFETTSNHKVIISLMALPSPYIPGGGDPYPHSGDVRGSAYRRPWTRGTLISTCELLSGGSALNDLRGKNPQIELPERFEATVSYLMNVEVIPSSNPTSPDHLDLKELVCLLKETRPNNPCQESFIMLTSDQMCFENRKKDLFLPEEMMVVDLLPQFKKHLPALKTKLSRLRTLLVADPLLRPTEEAFRLCASYETPWDMNPSHTPMNVNIDEEFCKESVKREESLQLPEVVELYKLVTEKQPGFSSILGHLNVVPEHLDEQPSVLDVLRKDTSVPGEISRYVLPKSSCRGGTTDSILMASESAEREALSTEMELDLVLSPAPKVRRPGLSLSDLRKEDESLLDDLSLVSAKAQREMQKSVREAESHPDFVLRLMLAEPVLDEPAVDFQPLTEALNIERESFVSFGGALMEAAVTLCDSLTFTEKISSGVSSVLEIETEVFKHLPLEHEAESLLASASVRSVWTDKTGSSAPKKTEAFHIEAAADVPSRETGWSLKAVQTHTLREEVAECAANTNINDMTTNNVFLDDASILSAGKNDVCERKPERSDKVSDGLKVPENSGNILVSRCAPQKQLDLLSAFMILRSQNMSPVTPASQNHLNTTAEASQPAERRSPPRLTQEPELRPMYAKASVSGNASREQREAARRFPPSDENSRVIQVQATDSQRHAYCELLGFSQPRLAFAKQLGLSFPAWRDFSSLAPDQTHFLLKQQEVALRRTRAQGKTPSGDEELLFSQVSLLHVLVTSKDLLLKCDLSIAVEYLREATETYEDQNLDRLVKRLQIILHIGRTNQEVHLKLLGLRELLASRMHDETRPDTSDRILLIMSVDSDDGRRAISEGLSQLTAVAFACPEENKNKVSGASVISRVHDNTCTVVYEQHIGPDFPWSVFTLVVEMDQPGRSPWATVCREHSVHHLTFNTVLPDSGDEQASWRLEDNVTYTLLVTEHLCCPGLLQMLESEFNITVLERDHCPSLQMLGGTHHYSIITVDESTAILVQEQYELCQEQAGEALVMRLTALSLQYSCCWMVLHCPDIQGGGISSEAYSNLVLLYSSLVLFSTRSEGFEVKVLMVSEVFEMARWVSRICFHRLMASERDPVGYLDREWLALMTSQEDACLLQFPCINPLVSQLMLRRALSLQWLLGASVSQLSQLLPEVPHKVLKLFSETTSLFSLSAKSRPASPMRMEPDVDVCVPGGLWTAAADQHPRQRSSPGFLFGCGSAGSGSDSPAEDSGTDFRLDASCPFDDPGVPVQRIQAGEDLWKDEGRSKEKVPLSGLRSRAGREVERGGGRWVRRPFGFLAVPRGPVLLQPAARTFSHPSPPGEAPLWGQSPTAAPESLPAGYGSKCRKGEERKRGGEAAGLPATAERTPLKKGRLNYQTVPERSNGQTRLTLF